MVVGKGAVKGMRKGRMKAAEMGGSILKEGNDGEGKVEEVNDGERKTGISYRKK